MTETAAAPVFTTGLPYGLPEFEAITHADFAPAFAEAIAAHDREIVKIATAAEPPSFENTIVALERSGRALNRVSAVFFNLVSTDGTPAMLDLEETVSAQLAAHDDAITLNSQLFSRIDAVYQQREGLNLDAESRWLIERVHLEFRRSGAGLDQTAATRLRAINEELSRLGARFGTYLLDETRDLGVLVTDEAELVGLGAADRAAAREAAAQAGHPDGWLIDLVLPTGHPWLAKLYDRPTRQRVYEASSARGRRGGAHDTRALALRIATLRAERASLLGFDSHAAYVLADETAGSPQAVQRLLSQLTSPAVANAQAEADALQELIDDEDEPFALRPWDWDLYTERRRQREHDIDSERLAEWFELERVLVDGVFWAAERLYDVHLHERHDLHGYHPDVRVFEVWRAGQGIGLFLFDPYARATKRGGAWMSSFVDQSRLLGEQAVVVNVLNLPKPGPGEPTLLSIDEVTTLFHEFGHGLHGLLSDVTYPRFSGTNVPRDFVELPSQFNETWAFDPEVLAHCAINVHTGEPLPAELIERLREAKAFNQGHDTLEYLQATVIDLAWHSLSAAQAAELRAQAGDDLVDAPAVAEQFEDDALERAGLLFSNIAPRYRTSYFQHVFAGGYSAGYYSYIWSEVLDADAERWFAEHGGLNREAGEHYLETLLRRGGSQDPKLTYVQFRGHEAQIEPLLERRGLTA